jgi:protein-disulfide isomerase
MSIRLESAVSGLLGIAAIAIAVSVVHRTFFAASVASAASVSPVPVFLNSWRDALPLGIGVGSRDAPVKIVVLADLECPACRGLHASLDTVLRKRPTSASIVYVSFPLSQHRFAMSAARGAECAKSYGKFREWIDAVYRGQDSLGLKSWGEYARDAGIADTAAVSKCARNPASVARIDAGIAFGKKIHLAFTPTVIVNGWRYSYTPGSDDLVGAIDSLAAGRAPFDTAVRMR